MHMLYNVQINDIKLITLLFFKILFCVCVYVSVVCVCVDKLKLTDVEGYG